MKTALLLIAATAVCTNGAHARPPQPLLTVPFEVAGEKIFLKARVNGSEELDLQFDTGAGSTVINEATAKSLGLVASGETKNEGAAGSASRQGPGG